MTRKDVLETTVASTTTDRNEQHGEPDPGFTVADLKERDRMRGKSHPQVKPGEKDYVWDWFDKTNGQAPAKALRALKEQEIAYKEVECARNSMGVTELWDYFCGKIRRGERGER